MGCVVGGHNGLAAAAYLAGAGLTVVVLATHPGGGVSAVNGRNAAMAVLADRRRRGEG